jgi:hypothetical protein
MTNKRLTVLRIVHGEYEFKAHLITPLSTTADEVASTFYADDGGVMDRCENEFGYLFNAGELFVCVVKDLEITPNQAKTIQKLLG